MNTQKTVFSEVMGKSSWGEESRGLARAGPGMAGVLSPGAEGAEQGCGRTGPGSKSPRWVGTGSSSHRGGPSHTGTAVTGEGQGDGREGRAGTGKEGRSRQAGRPAGRFRGSGAAGGLGQRG